MTNKIITKSVLQSPNLQRRSGLGLFGFRGVFILVVMLDRIVFRVLFLWLLVVFGGFCGFWWFLAVLFRVSLGVLGWKSSKSISLSGFVRRSQRFVGSIANAFM